MHRTQLLFGKEGIRTEAKGIYESMLAESASES